MSDSEFREVLQALNSDPIRNQLANWTDQRDLLRQTLKEMWEEEDTQGSQFKKWWCEVQTEIRTALVLTALEDLPNSFSFAFLSSVVCPELVTETLLHSNGIKVVELTEMLLTESENTTQIFSTFKELFAFEDKQATALNALKLARSCILLQFVVAILLVYMLIASCLIYTKVFNNEQEESVANV
jgi:hypothetical protein